MQLFVLYFKMFKGHNYIVYEVKCNFLYKMDFNFFAVSLDFAEINNNENMSIGMIYRMH